jgi:hypothetical protein
MAKSVNIDAGADEDADVEAVGWPAEYAVRPPLVPTTFLANTDLEDEAHMFIYQYIIFCDICTGG